MNILFICHEYPPNTLVGGIGIFVRNLGRALVRNGHNVVVIGLYRRDTDEVSDDEGVSVIRLAMRKRILPIAWWWDRLRMFKKIKHLITRKDIDIIETSDFDAGYWLAPRWNVPRVVRLNGGEVYFRTLLHEQLKRLHQWKEAASLTKADAISSVSQYTLEQTRKIFKLKANQCPILPNPVDTNYFKPDTEIPVAPGRIIYSGTVIAKKGVLDLAHSIIRVFDHLHEAHIILAGSDSVDIKENRSTKAMFLEIIPRKYHNRIQFTGRISHTELKKLLLAAHVCVYPSYLEAFPNAWIEAMACGKAVVASITGSGPEVITHGLNGLLCHPTEHVKMAAHIVDLLTNNERNITIGKQARKRVLAIDINKMVEKNLDWYRKVIEEFHVSHPKPLNSPPRRGRGG